MNDWILGYAIGAVVVLIVVAVLLMMIVGVRRVAAKAEGIVEALHDVRDRTEPLWQLGATVQTAERIVAAAADARTSLTPVARS